MKKLCACSVTVVFLLGTAYCSLAQERPPKGTKDELLYKGKPASFWVKRLTDNADVASPSAAPAHKVDVSYCLEAVQALKEIGANDDQVVPGLIQALIGQELRVRSSALDALASMRLERNTSQLVYILKETFRQLQDREKDINLTHIQYQGSRIELTRLQKDNDRLQAENAKLRKQVAALEKKFADQGNGSAPKPKDEAGKANLQQIGLAMHVYHDNHFRFPPAAICNKQGKPLLSWRVALLPCLGQQKLHNQFKLDEPWDSEHNKKLLPQMPAIYALPRADAPIGTMTHYRVFAGPQAAFEWCKSRRVADITDGLSNTFMVVEAAEAVPWTKPDELLYDPQKPLPRLGGCYAGGFHAAFMDASVRFLSHTLPEKTLRALITPDGNEVIQLPD
jgi:regulator of replication initiation timing